MMYAVGFNIIVLQSQITPLAEAARGINCDHRVQYKLKHTLSFTKCLYYKLQVAAWSPYMFCNFHFVDNHLIATFLTATEAKEKMDVY
jgi:hypothetical protein